MPFLASGKSLCAAADEAIKEFAAGAKGYATLVINAEVNSQLTSMNFTRSRAMEKTSVGRL